MKKRIAFFLVFLSCFAPLGAGAFQQGRTIDGDKMYEWVLATIGGGYGRYHNSYKIYLGEFGDYGLLGNPRWVADIRETVGELRNYTKLPIYFTENYSEANVDLWIGPRELEPMNDMLRSWYGAGFTWSEEEFDMEGDPIAGFNMGPLGNGHAVAVAMIMSTWCVDGYCDDWSYIFDSAWQGGGTVRQELAPTLGPVGDSPLLDQDWCNSQFANTGPNGCGSYPIYEPVDREIIAMVPVVGARCPNLGASCIKTRVKPIWKNAWNSNARYCPTWIEWDPAHGVNVIRTTAVITDIYGDPLTDPNSGNYWFDLSLEFRCDETDCYAYIRDVKQIMDDPGCIASYVYQEPVLQLSIMRMSISGYPVDDLNDAPHVYAYFSWGTGDETFVLREWGFVTPATR